MKTICSNDFRIPVDFGTESTIADGYGGQTLSFIPVLSTFCKVEDISDREEYKTQSRRAVSTYRMTTRYSEDIVSKLQVQWKDKVGRIVGAPNNVDERDEWLIFKVEVNDGE